MLLIQSIVMIALLSAAQICRIGAAQQTTDDEVYVNPYPPEIPPPKVIPPSITVSIGNYTNLLVDLHQIEDEADLPVVKSAPDALPLTTANLTDITVVATDYIQAFALFKIKYQRSYKTSVEEQIRLRNFLRNMGAAFRNQTTNPYASYGINNFSDYDAEELTRKRNLTDYYKHFEDTRTSVPNQRRVSKNESKDEKQESAVEGDNWFVASVGTEFLSTVDTSGHLFWGKKKETKIKNQQERTSENVDQAPKSRPFSAQSSPLSLDWRAYGAVTSVRQQGNCGGCWAFAAAGNIEGAWRIAGKGLVSLSEQSLISCDTVSGNQGCAGGVPQYAFQYLLKHQDGYIARRDTYPFASVLGNTPACRPTQYIKGARISRYVSITRDEDVMMQFVANIGPIAVAVDSTSWTAYTGGIITDCLSINVDHAVLIVGFDASSNPPYWIVKNSWGVDWGEAGYIRIAMGSDQCLITRNPSTALVAADATVPEYVVTAPSTTTTVQTSVPKKVDPNSTVIYLPWDDKQKNTATYIHLLKGDRKDIVLQTGQLNDSPRRVPQLLGCCLLSSLLIVLFFL